MKTQEQDQLDLLRQTRDRAVRLVEDVRRQRDELRDAPASPALDPAALAEGRAALDTAVASAERMLTALESALREIEPESE